MKEKKIEIEKLKLPDFAAANVDKFTSIDCPSCSDKVNVDDVELQNKLGKCKACNVVFSIDPQIDDLLTKSRTKERVDRPAGVESFEFRDELEIELDQPLPMWDIVVLTLLPFVVIFSFASYFKDDYPVALMIASAAALIMTKSIIRLIQKKRYKIAINIKQDQIVIAKQPNGYAKQRTYEVSEIEQAYVGMSSNGGHALYFVLNKEEGQVRQKVVDRIMNPFQVKFVEQELENYLGIADRKVPGEI